MRQEGRDRDLDDAHVVGTGSVRDVDVIHEEEVRAQEQAPGGQQVQGWSIEGQNRPREESTVRMSGSRMPVRAQKVLDDDQGRGEGEHR